MKGFRVLYHDGRRCLTWHAPWCRCGETDPIFFLDLKFGTIGFLGLQFSWV